MQHLSDQRPCDRAACGCSLASSLLPHEHHDNLWLAVQAPHLHSLLVSMHIACKG